NPVESKMVRRIFSSYLVAGCVSGLKTHLDQNGIKSKVRVSANGTRSGGTPYSRGALYQILKNRIYIGEIPHRDQSYPRQQEAIIPKELWERAQQKLRSDHQGRRTGILTNSQSLLTGLIRDADGNRFTPSHTAKNGKRYRYYVSQSVIRKADEVRTGPTRL